MVKVAVAGGTGAVGKALADVLAGQTKHEGIILTRKDPGEKSLPLPQHTVNYDDVSSLTAFLEEHDVHTIISAFGINGKSLAVSQSNLIQAANASKATKRFIPSSFATAYPEDGPQILPPLQAYFDSLEALKSSDLEWAVVHNGIFLDYYFPDTLQSYYDHTTLVVDIPNGAAAIPGTGNERLTLTSIHDSARFVIAALDLPEWPRELRVVGDTLTYNELVKLAEEARGVKFDVKYDDLEKLKKFEVSELPGHRNDYKRFPKDVLLPFLSIFERWTAEGLSEIKFEGSLTEKFPTIKPLKVKELMDKYWKV
ncbi:unnamed protein product [Clonostachys byssicola]|uniref:NmrA-like domain-containing protein n=1 Tax=Clonostachys byssicola TaxID=160290 RepID=A0A9N9UHJ3_9HYPO|nr:unnamed protein product [Clonostachys byssicola]